MNINLLNYDIYPRVVLENSEASITIAPLGDHVKLEKNESYKLVILPINENSLLMAQDPLTSYNVVSNDFGNIEFAHTFKDEQEYFIRLYNSKDELIVQLSVYAVAEDLFALRPYKGDTHIHTHNSDGKESPEVVIAYYRKYGYDFLAITDHRLYQPSLDGINAYKDAPIDLKIFPGEEVHPPGNDVHIVNFGGEISINKMFTKDAKKYNEDVKEIASKLQVDDRINKLAFASCKWVFDKIRATNGLGIFPHPHWVSDVHNVPDIFSKELFSNNIPDAFEILGGQSVPENEKQISMYYNLKHLGYDLPIVGASDSHGCFNRAIPSYFDRTKTIVFAKSCEKIDIIKAIKSNYSVAVDSYDNNDYRIHGDYRLTTYTRFLMDNYFTIHDELCFEEGLQMMRYIHGKKDSLDYLNLMQGRTSDFMIHCFGK